MQRITISQILEDPWFKKGYKPPVFDEKYETSFDDVDAAFGDSEVSQLDYLFQNIQPLVVGIRGLTFFYTFTD